MATHATPAAAAAASASATVPPPAHPHKASNTTPAKTKHYAAVLSDALLRGAWADATVGKNYKGYDVDWAELLRKWEKHGGANPDLIHHLREISLLYLTHSSPSSSGYITVPHSIGPGTSASSDASAGTTSSFVHVHHPSTAPVTPSRSGRSAAPGEASTHDLAQSPSRSIKEKAAYFHASDLDGDDVEPDSWREGNGWWRGVPADRREEVQEGIRGLEALMMKGRLNAAERESAKLCWAYHLHALGSHDAAVRLFDEVNWAADPQAAIVPGNAAILDRARGKCLQAMSLELIEPADPLALEYYLNTISIIGTVIPVPSTAYLPVSSSTAPAFDTVRELNRWLCAALVRASVLQSRLSGPGELVQALRILRTYHAYAGSWPASFRPCERQRMLILYLNTLAAAYPSSYAEPARPYLLSSGESRLSARETWRREVVAAIRQGRALLGASTTFPRAGSINYPVTRFVTICAALADRCPGLVDEVVDALYWAQTLTFHSQGVLRHLVRLSAARGDWADARRAFETYVQLVGKARETAAPEVSLQLKRRPTDTAAAGPEQIREEAHQAQVQLRQRRASEAAAELVTVTEQEQGPEAVSVQDREGAERVRKAQEEREDDERDEIEELAEMTAESEMESDKVYIRTLCLGARIVAREMGEPEEAVKYVEMAEGVMKEAEGKGVWMSRKTRAGVLVVKGLVKGGLVMQGPPTPARREALLNDCISLLSAATQQYDTPDTQFHLAYFLAVANETDRATAAIKQSLQLGSAAVTGAGTGGISIAHWHLAALLRTADRNWQGAGLACEMGVRLWRELEEAGEQEEEVSAGSTGAGSGSGPNAPEAGADDNEVVNRDFATAPGGGGSDSPPDLSTEDSYDNAPPALQADGAPVVLPKHASHARQVPASPRMQRAARLRDVMALRQTQLAILEKQAGPLVALEGHKELFAFFKARSGRQRGRYGYGLGYASGARSVITVEGGGERERDARSVRSGVGAGLGGSIGGGVGSVLGLDKLRAGGLGMTSTLDGRGEDDAEEVVDGSIINVRAPTPQHSLPDSRPNSAHPSSSSRAQDIGGDGLPRITHSGATSRTTSRAVSVSNDLHSHSRRGGVRGHGDDNDNDTDSPPSSVRFDDDAKEKVRSRTLGSGRTLGRLHVPLLKSHIGKGRPGRPGSIRGLESPSAPDLNFSRQNRITSQSSIALSTTSATPSYFSRLRHPRESRHRQTSVSTSKAPSPPPLLLASHGRTPAESRLLSDLWLASAATFRRAGELGQCRGAIQEGEAYDAENPEVWVQLALWRLVQEEEEEEGTGTASESKPGTDAESALAKAESRRLARLEARYELAESCLSKALALDPAYPAAILHLAKLNTLRGRHALASAVLNQVLEGAQPGGGSGAALIWASPEGWLLRAECRRVVGDESGEREDLGRALRCEAGRGVRGWAVVRWWV